MRRVVSAVAFLLLLHAVVSPHHARASSSSIVISQVYGGGGNSGATLKNDFIELFNRGSSTVSLSGWSVQYASTTGTSWQVTALTGSLAPGAHFLIQEAQGAGGSTNLPAPDVTGTIAMAAGAGKVALVMSATAIASGTSCPSGVVDLVGYGTGTNCFEGSGPTATLTNTTAASRLFAGCRDTDSNVADFSTGAPAPRNALSPATPCDNPSGTGTANPASAAPGDSIRLSVTVTPGSNPTSTGLGVVANLSAIGGLVNQTLVDDGSNGDPAAGDNEFSFATTINPSTAIGGKSLPFTVSDSLGRSATGTIALTVTGIPTVLSIHDIQGPGSTSPYVGQFVRTEGVVTAIRFNNGFFIQSPDAETDADPNTSEGVFVFTASAPPAAAAVGNRVRVTGTVTEFLADASSLTATEITSPSVVLLETGDALPSAVTLTSADTSPAGPLDQLERFEGMRVHVDALIAVAPTQGTVSEASASSASNGVYYGVLPAIPRPFREPGVELPMPLPPAAPCCVPRFDGNPERIRVDSNGNKAFTADQTTEVMTGAMVSNITGVLDYSTHAYTILPDLGAQGTVSGLHGFSAVSVPGADRFTIATANLERFFDTTDTPGISDVALTATAYANRRAKVALQICDVMRAPDIIGVEEVENLDVLTDIATSANATPSCGGSQYAAFLFEGNDPGGIDDGFLVNLARVDVRDVHQEGKTATYIDPNTGQPALLNDRPPTVLAATVHAAGAAPQNVTVIANHLRSLNGIDDDVPGGDGNRVRTKRLRQAEYLGELIESMQMSNGAEPVIAVGDFNAFEFSDGYVDVIGTIKGTPAPADQVVLASTNVPNAAAPMVDLIESDQSSQRYSYSFDGNAQSLDHLLATQAAVNIFDHVEWGHSNADFPESFRADASRPERLSDHDPVVAYFVLAATTTTSVVATPNPSPFGDDITFTATVGTPAPATSGFVQFSDNAGYSASIAVASGQASVIVPASSFGVGAHVMSASFTDGVNFASSSSSAPFTVIDVVAPVIDGLVNIVAEATGPSGATVTFAPTATDDVDGSVPVECGPLSGSTFALGSTTVTCTAMDKAGHVSIGEFLVTVRDTTAPSAPVLSVAPGMLWPANHKMVRVVVGAQSSDAVSTVVCAIKAISSNEPDNGLGDGDTANDVGPTSGLTTSLRAERSGGGNGRVYTITVACSDRAGNTSSSSVGVTVPKNP